MRLFKLISWVLLCGPLAFIATDARAAAVSRVAGKIVVAKATGTVTATSLVDKSTRTLSDKDELTQQYVVTTGANSRVILVFSNGATLNLGSDSTLSIEEFLQDPFDEKVALADLKEEPATSSTRLKLSRGELVGNVKHLHQDRGSSFIVDTPVGAAGIRGTTFRIVFRPDANGRVIFTLSTADGSVLFEAPANAAVQVGTGKEVTVDVEVAVDRAAGTVTVVSPPKVAAPADIPAATQTNIATVAQQIVEASKGVILTTTPTVPGAAQPESPTPQKTEEAPKSTEPEKPAVTPPAENKFTPPNNTPPQVTTPPPDVTPGAGAN